MVGTAGLSMAEERLDGGPGQEQQNSWYEKRAQASYEIRWWCEKNYEKMYPVNTGCCHQVSVLWMALEARVRGFKRTQL